VLPALPHSNDLTGAHCTRQFLIASAAFDQLPLLGNSPKLVNDSRDVRHPHRLARVWSALRLPGVI